MSSGTLVNTGRWRLNRSDASSSSWCMQASSKFRRSRDSTRWRMYASDVVASSRRLATRGKDGHRENIGRNEINVEITILFQKDRPKCVYQ
ncbi:hypothetical protein OsI_38114 [Oryza sativa Indica Group]|uniref:Uncharacterized protein n=1 Tax=Oryza sativa subsp. indica TaxID=39946 RepID=B8BPB5_ORYSI|nr:hypothetical protein OsI_38114 [Oryza sativa Indica Group]